MKLLRNLPWVQVEKTKRVAAAAKETPEQIYARLSPEKQEWVDDLKASIQEAEDDAAGRIKLPTWDEFRAQQKAAKEPPSATREAA